MSTIMHIEGQSYSETVILFEIVVIKNIVHTARKCYCEINMIFFFYQSDG